MFTFVLFDMMCYSFGDNILMSKKGTIDFFHFILILEGYINVEKTFKK